MKRKAMGKSTLLTYIIGVVIVVVLIPSFISWGQSLMNESSVEICRLGLLGKANSKAAGTSQVDLSADCPRRNIEFQKRYVEISENGDIDRLDIVINGKYVKKFDEINEDIVYYVIAEEMRDCWYKIGEGEINPFEQSTFWGSSSFCLLCSTFSFDEDAQTILGEMDSLSSYLDNTMPGSDQSYKDYFDIAEKLNKDYIIFSIEEDHNVFSMVNKINPANDYALVYQVTAASWLQDSSSTINTLWDLTLGQILPEWFLGGKTGDDDVHIMFFKEVSDSSDACQRIYN